MKKNVHKTIVLSLEQYNVFMNQLSEAIRLQQPTIVSNTDSPWIYKVSDGSYRYLDETGDFSNPFTSLAAARIELEDYCDILNTGKWFLYETP